MSAYNSQVSAFKIAGNIIPAIGTMSLSAQRPPQDVTPIGSANTYLLSGNLATMVSLDVYYNKADHNLISGDLWNPAGFACAIVFNNSGSALQDEITGTATVVSMDIVTVTSDVVRGSFTLQFNGVVLLNGIDPIIGTIENPPA